jgi:hypothetical protein
VPCHRPDLDRGDVVLSPCQPRETRSDGNTGPGGFHCAGLASQRCSDGCRTEHCCDRGDGASGHRRRPLRLRHGHAVHAPDRSCACSRYERDKENKLRSRPVHQARCVPLIFRRVHQSHASVHFFQLPRFAFDFFSSPALSEDKNQRRLFFSVGGLSNRQKVYFFYGLLKMI